MNLVILGGGYVGAVTAVCFAGEGHDVTLIEVAAGRLHGYQGGHVPFFEPGLDERFHEARDAGRLHVAGNAAESLAGADAVLVCVGTPLSPDGEADLSQVEAACRTIARHGPDHIVVVIRSTLPMGTSPLLAEWLERPTLEAVASNPEFLAQGTAVRDFLEPARIVIGTPDGRPSRASELVEHLYRRVAATRIVTDFASAEMIKNVANGFLATKLSYVNEVADLCEAYGADVDAVVSGIGLDPRIGSGYLRPGIGFGGSCIPKELANLVRLGRERGLPMRMFAAAAAANDERSQMLTERLERTLGGLVKRRVALLGLSFKPNTDDTRYSPSVALAQALIARGAVVIAHDPAVPLEVSDRIPGLTRTATTDAAIAGSDLVILATEWAQYRLLDWQGAAALARSRVIFDGRNALDVEALRAAGWWVLRIGTEMLPPPSDLEVPASPLVGSR